MAIASIEHAVGRGDAHGGTTSDESLRAAQGGVPEKRSRCCARRFRPAASRSPRASATCPTGCARPYIAEIVLIGRGPERDHLSLDVAFDGSRLSKLYAEDVAAGEIRDTLDPFLAAYAKDRDAGERFGDFVIRVGFVAKTGSGPDVHERTGPPTAPT